MDLYYYLYLGYKIGLILLSRLRVWCGEDIPRQAHHRHHRPGHRKGFKSACIVVFLNRVANFENDPDPVEKNLIWILNPDLSRN